jgi:hypothetical protein
MIHFGGVLIAKKNEITVTGGHRKMVGKAIRSDGGLAQITGGQTCSGE